MRGGNVMCATTIIPAHLAFYATDAGWKSEDRKTSGVISPTECGRKKKMC